MTKPEDSLGREQDEGPRPGNSPARSKTNYGADDPWTLFILCAVGVGSFLGAELSQVFRASLGDLGSFIGLLIGLVVGLVFLGFAVVLYWGGRSWKPRELESLVRRLPWGGSELVLDIGCGRGMLTNMVAGRLVDGMVVGVDLWRKRDISGNDPSSARDNARRVGALDKVSLVRADPSYLPFVAGAFDAIVSGLAVDRLSKAKALDQAVEEMNRVLKGGGRVALVIAGQSPRCFKALKSTQMRDLTVSHFRMGLFPPAQTILGRKSF